MSETVQEQLGQTTAAWKEVGEAVSKASDLYLQELEAYLDWTKNVQKDLLEYYWFGLRQVTRAGEEQVALFQRLGATLPNWWKVPTGTETISGMVGNIVKQTQKEE